MWKVCWLMICDKFSSINIEKNTRIFNTFSYIIYGVEIGWHFIVFLKNEIWQ